MGELIKIDSAAASLEPRQYLTFTLGGEMYGVETLSVKEIIEYGQVTTVPMMPASIRGVINLRGAVVPVIDLKARFGADFARRRRGCHPLACRSLLIRDNRLRCSRALLA